MGEIAAPAAIGGVLAALVTVIGYLLASNRADRSGYESAIDRAEARADAAEQRTRDVRSKFEAALEAKYRCEETVAELRAELAALHRRDGAR